MNNVEKIGNGDIAFSYAMWAIFAAIYFGAIAVVCGGIYASIQYMEDAQAVGYIMFTGMMLVLVGLLCVPATDAGQAFIKRDL